MILFPSSPTTGHFLRSYFCTTHILDTFQKVSTELYSFFSPFVFSESHHPLMCVGISLTLWKLLKAWGVMRTRCSHAQALSNPNPTKTTGSVGLSEPNYTGAHTHTLTPLAPYAFITVGNAKLKYQRSFKISCFGGETTIPQKAF